MTHIRTAGREHWAGGFAEVPGLIASLEAHLHAAHILMVEPVAMLHGQRESLLVSMALHFPPYSWAVAQPHMICILQDPEPAAKPRQMQG
jgi:hypothetical protein